MKREVFPLSTTELKKWVLLKHYAKRKPRIQFGFGLYINNVLKGIITYGLPATPFVARGLCGKKYEDNVLELSRLVINSKVPKNSASFLISHSMKLLPKKYKIIVSYADTSVGHIGYIYQATNFIYTGLTIPMKEWKKEGENLHSQNVSKRESLENKRNNPDFKQIYRPRKHRYIFFRTGRGEQGRLKKELKYEILDYPKGKSERYVSPDITETQSLLLHSSHISH